MVQDTGSTSNNRDDSLTEHGGKGHQEAGGYPFLSSGDGRFVSEVMTVRDPLVLHTPRWLNTIVSMAAEAVLLVVTVAIITAMWLPAYLSSRGQATDNSDHNHEDMVGMFPRGR